MNAKLTPVHIVSLGCARNEVDSEELAGRLAAGGFRLVADPEQAEAVVVNTCGFIEQAKKDSVDELLAAADLKETGRAKAVIAVGCMAERYGTELAKELPEADAVLGFDDYASIAERVRTILNGGHVDAPTPRDRRLLLPLAPVERVTPQAVTLRPRARLVDSATASLKIASGCDRRCAFCAIPRFRGSYVSRPVDEILAEARWLVEQGVREVVLVSENTSSYGKDLGSRHELERLLGQLDRVDGLDWVRVSYLQPAEIRPSLIAAMANATTVVPYFDIPFQHASGTVLRRMRRFGDAESFLGLLETIRAASPEAGIRSNVIVGFPGETEADVQTLQDFLISARLDAVGVFEYSDEDDTEGATLDSHVDPDAIAERAGRVASLVDELLSQRSEERIGSHLDVLIEEISDEVWGRATIQGPETDGHTRVVPSGADLAVGDIVATRVVASDGVDLVAEEKR